MARALIMAWMLLFGAIGTGLIGPNRTSIESEYGLTTTALGVGVAAIQVTAAALVLALTPRLAGLGGFALLLAGLVLQATGFGLIWLTRSVVWLGVGWFAIVSGSALGAIANTLTARLFRDNPRRGVTLLHAFNGVGKVVGPLIAAVALAHHWRLSFAGVGALTLVMVLAFLTGGRELKRVSAPPASRVAGAEWALARRAEYWLRVLPFGLISGGELAFVTLLPMYCEEGLGTSPEVASLLLTVHLAGLASGRFITAPLSSRVSNSAIIGWCLLSGLLVVPALLTTNVAVAGVCLFIAGGLFSSTWPAYYAQISDWFEGRRPMLDYGSALCNSLGISMCVLLSSCMADISLKAAMLFGPGVLALFGALFFLSRLSAERG